LSRLLVASLYSAIFTSLFALNAAWARAIFKASLHSCKLGIRNWAVTVRRRTHSISKYDSELNKLFGYIDKILWKSKFPKYFIDFANVMGFMLILDKIFAYRKQDSWCPRRLGGAWRASSSPRQYEHTHLRQHSQIRTKPDVESVDR
jgi:hypothetical protein